MTMKRPPAKIDGRWKGKIEGPDGSIDLVFTFHVEGEKLTGSVTSEWGETPFETGTISGNKLTFDTRFEGMVIHHVGTLDGDSIALRVTSPDWDTEMTLARETPAGSN